MEYICGDTVPLQQKLWNETYLLFPHQEVTLKLGMGDALNRKWDIRGMPTLQLVKSVLGMLNVTHSFVPT
jgi:hypothetical protein